nr:MAG TPA: hypothetical protein [Caudoviricetes sp.]
MITSRPSLFSALGVCNCHSSTYKCLSLTGIGKQREKTI